MNGGSSIRTYKRALDSCAYGLCCVQKADGSWLAPSSHRHSQRPKNLSINSPQKGSFQILREIDFSLSRGSKLLFETVLDNVNFDFGKFQIWQDAKIHII